jgi:tRNA(Ile)-lysidine synthase
LRREFLWLGCYDEPQRQQSAIPVGTQLAVNLKRHIETAGLTRAGDRLGVAVSGGADSLALLLLLLELRERLGIVLSVVHFNHKLRGKASDADEKFVAQLAAKHGLEFYADRADVAGKAKRERLNLEDAARRARYLFFKRLVDEGRVTRVAVAHTADDQAETVLAHLLRGTGLAGLGGIHPVAGSVIRPLLEFRRAELHAYLQRKRQTWREDASNRDTTRTRARIRQKLLPLLEKQFQATVVEQLSSLARLAREDETFLDDIVTQRAESIVQRSAGRAQISVDHLIGAPKQAGFNAEVAESKPDTEVTEKRKTTRALSTRLIRKIVDGLKTRGGQLSSQHVEAVMELALHGENGKSLQMPGSIEVRRERDALVFCAGKKPSAGAATSQPTKSYAYQIDLSRQGALVHVPQLGCAFRFMVIDWLAHRVETNDAGAVLDRDRLRTPLVLRNWRPGDTLHPAGRQGQHKLKRLLNEKRISRWERDGWPVLTSNGTLVWARGFPADASVAAGENTRAGVLIVEEAF